MKINTLDNIVKDIVNAHNRGNYQLISKKTMWWVYENYNLKPTFYFPYNYHDLTRYKRSDAMLNEFWEWFSKNIFESDLSLNNSLSWIYHWITNGRNVNDNLTRFKQRCYVSNCLRQHLGICRVRIKYSAFTYGERSRWSNTIVAFGIKDACRQFLMGREIVGFDPDNHGYTKYKIHSIKKYNGVPLYCITQPTSASYKDCTTLHQEAWRYITSEISAKELNIESFLS